MAFFNFHTDFWSNLLAAACPKCFTENKKKLKENLNLKVIVYKGISSQHKGQFHLFN